MFVPVHPWYVSEPQVCDEDSTIKTCYSFPSLHNHFQEAARRNQPCCSLLPSHNQQQCCSAWSADPLYCSGYYTGRLFHTGTGQEGRCLSSKELVPELTECLAYQRYCTLRGDRRPRQHKLMRRTAAGSETLSHNIEMSATRLQ